jgi:hypothetical protein
MRQEAIALELVTMAERDQAMRRQAAADRSVSPSIFDRPHAERLREIISRIGWPTRSRVGDEAEHAAWLIAQHAIHDPAFQERCLSLLLEQPATEVCPQHAAYLEDRINALAGRPQRYGTQLIERGGELVPASLADEATVDELRRSVGLGPLAEYVAAASRR